MVKTKTTLKRSASKKKSPVKRTRSTKRVKTVAVDIIQDEDNIFSPEELITEEEDFFPEFPKTRAKSPKKTSTTVDSDEDLIDPEIDQQRKFFSNLAADLKNKKKTVDPNTRAPVKKSLSLYRRLAFRFVILTAFLILVVAYFSFSKLTISIIPKGEVINDTLLLKIYKNPPTTKIVSTNSAERIAGQVKVMDIKIDKKYNSSGEEFIGEEIQGKVKIINNYSRNQPLVATTRLLTPDNKLYRIKKAVNVPAGGEVEVGIYTNNPSANMAVGLTTFTIPGLWVGLQDKIYAKNDQDFVFKQKIRKYIKASDISRANQDIDNLLLEKAKSEKLPTGDWLYQIVGPIKTDVDAKVGEDKASFTAKAEGEIVAVSFSRAEASKLALAKLSLFVPDDKELIEFDKKNISYALDSYDADQGIATVKVSFRGVIALRTDTKVIDRKQLVNLNIDQLKSYLNNFPEIKEYHLKFFPSFIKTAPRLPERIKIEVQNLNNNK